MALKLGDYIITKAGFGADCGAEKFFDIKCRVAGYRPSAVVIVASVRALQLHGGASSSAPGQPPVGSSEGERRGGGGGRGQPRQASRDLRLLASRWWSRSTASHRYRRRAGVKQAAHDARAGGVESNVWARGGAGEELAQAVVEACAQPERLPLPL